VSWLEGDPEPDVLMTGVLTITGGPFPSDAEWRRLIADMRRRWKSPSPLFGPLRAPEDTELDRLLAASGPRPSRRQGLQRYWERLYKAVERAGLGQRWQDWRALRRFVIRREQREAAMEAALVAGAERLEREDEGPPAAASLQRKRGRGTRDAVSAKCPREAAKTHQKAPQSTTHTNGPAIG
jgi:hypothetical protein